MSTAASISTAIIFVGIAAIAWIAALVDKHRERQIEEEEHAPSENWNFPPRWNPKERYVGPPGRERVDDRFRRRAA